MEPFENNEFDTLQDPAPTEEIPRVQPQQEPQPVVPPQPSAYHGTGTGRKESPYANSPYVAYQQPREEYHYQPQTEPPVKPKKEKKTRKPFGKKLLAAVLAVALVAGSCCITAEVLQEHYDEKMDSDGAGNAVLHGGRNSMCKDIYI